MIYRLARAGQPATRRPADSASATGIQILYTAIGVGCFVAVLAFIREPRVLQRYTYTLGVIGLVLLALPALLPVIDQRGPWHRRQDPDPARQLHHPARGVRQAGAGRLIRRLPGRQAGRAGAGRPPGARHRPAPGARPGPDPGGLGRQPAAAGLRERHRHQCGVHGPVRRDAVHRHLSGPPGCCSASSCSWRARSRPPSCSATSASDSTSGCTRSAGPNPSGNAYQLVQGLYGMGVRRAARQGPRRRPAVHHPAGAERLRHHRIRRGTRAWPG